VSWSTFSLGELVNIKTGKLDANASNEKGQYPFFTCSRNPLKIDKYAFDSDAILIAGNGDLNVKHYKGKFNAYQRTYVVTVNNTNTLDTRYLYYFMEKYVERLRELSIGGVIKYIKLGMLTEVVFPLPPLVEQKRIAAILDKADAIRRKRQQAIQLADDFLRAVFLDMFGDPVTNPKSFPVGTIRDFVETANYGSSGKASETEGEYPMLRMGNITYQGAWDFTKLKYIDLSDKDKPKYLTQKGDLLFNRTNSKELVGKTAVFEDEKPMAIAGYLVRVRANDLGNNYYISGYLNSKHGKKTLVGMCKSIVGMANINAQELQNIKILLPPIKLQNKFENIVKATKKKLKSFDKSSDLLDSNFNSLSQKAFAGKL
jgi:type I restriction enzyme S subunit